MAQICRKCSRVNPAEASYCYHDGWVLDGHNNQHGPLDSGAQPFQNPFVFPSGYCCQNFDQLALACHERWSEAVSLLHSGYLENFLRGLGRSDLALVARSAAQFPDANRGLDQFLDRLPSRIVEPPRLLVVPREVNLGQLRAGQDHQVQLRLVNQGRRLLHGSLTCANCLWLSLGDASGQRQKVFETRDQLTIALHVRGRELRAGSQPLAGKVVIESNGGQASVLVRAEVPVTPFAEGVLAGAMTPRQLAEKAKKAPKEAAELFEHGGVSRWYEQNGWVYPVRGPLATGVAAVQQFFEVLGLTTAPRVQLSESNVNFCGAVGDRLEHVVRVSTPEKRPIYASATSDQKWLQIGPLRLRGRTVTIPLVIPSIPDRPGGVLQARVVVTANGQQRFPVDVLLAVAAGAEQLPTVLEVVEDAIPVAQLADWRQPPRRRQRAP